MPCAQVDVDVARIRRRLQHAHLEGEHRALNVHAQLVEVDQVHEDHEPHERVAHERHAHNRWDDRRHDDRVHARKVGVVAAAVAHGARHARLEPGPGVRADDERAQQVWRLRTHST